MQTRTFTDSDGIERRRTQVRATDVTFLDGRGGNGSNNRSGGGGQNQQSPSGGPDPDFEPSDELPF
jgi:single-stranded DNA-binding protein